MATTTFQPARLTNISASYKSEEITLTVKVSLNDDNLGKAENLRSYLDAEVGGLMIEISPMQLNFQDMQNERAAKS